MICNYSFYKPLLNEAIMQQCLVVNGFSLTPTLVCFELIIILIFRKVLHSPIALWDTKPVGEHLACNINRLSEARTVAGWLDWGNSITDLVFARMGNDERF